MNEERMMNEAGCSALSKTTEEIFKKIFLPGTKRDKYCGKLRQ